MEVRGKVKLVGQTVDVGSSGFQKRELVITTDEQYPQHILINFIQDKCNLINDISVGNDVLVSINLRGREWINPQGEAKYFNDIQGWKVVKVSSAEIPTQQPSQPQLPNTAPTAKITDDEEDDDLPF